MTNMRPVHNKLYPKTMTEEIINHVYNRGAFASSKGFGDTHKDKLVTSAIGWHKVRKEEIKGTPVI